MIRIPPEDFGDIVHNLPPVFADGAAMQAGMLVPRSASQGKEAKVSTAQ